VPGRLAQQDPPAAVTAAVPRHFSNDSTTTRRQHHRDTRDRDARDPALSRVAPAGRSTNRTGGSSKPSQQQAAERPIRPNPCVVR
jgi:hypothetical protein